MRILTFTTLFPNRVRPHHGVFVENRLRHLVASGRVHARVVAPVPWFPFRNPVFRGYAELARVDREERRHGIPVLHPRYPLLPKLGMSTAPLTMYAAVGPTVDRLRRGGYEFDLIDAHYFYPDGVAAALLGRRTETPVVITARGSDLNLLPRFLVPRRSIRWAAERAAGLITVSGHLREVLIRLGVDGAKVHVVRNGVDLDLFRPPDRARARRAYHLVRPTLLSVGNLVELKGHDLVIRAMGELPGVDLLIVGDGPWRGRLRGLARELGVEERIRFLGRLPHEALPEVYGACDLLVLASSREGWPNVLLESMACGTPVVASAVSGVPEIVTAPEAGVLLGERSPSRIAAAVRAVLAQPPSRPATRAYAASYTWEETTRLQLQLFAQILGRDAS